MKILIIYNAVETDARLDEQDVLEQVELVSTALNNTGHQVQTYACTLDLAGLEACLQSQMPELVFNLTEALGAYACLIHVVPGLLESLNINYTGCPATAQMNSSHKTTAKRLLRHAGLPTPDWLEADGFCSQTDFPPGRYIRKHAWEHASIGLNEASVFAAATLAEAQTQLHSVNTTGVGCRSWFAEQFIPGREFNLALLADENGMPQVLPPAEIKFVNYADDQLRIVDYAAKWQQGSFAFQNTPRAYEFPETDTPLLERLRQLALAAWEAFDLRGYARVDFRIDEAGQPWILEINANPCIAPDSGFIAAATQAGISPDTVVARIAAAATVYSGLACVEKESCRETGTRETALFRTEKAEAEIIFREQVLESDAEAVRMLIRATGFFQEHEIPVAVELVQERLRNGLLVSGYHFVMAEAGGRLAGYAAYGEIPCTKGSWDLYWIAVHPDFQGKGLGRSLMREVENRISRLAGRKLYIETSSRPLYETTRNFYIRSGCKLEVLLQDYYGAGDGKLIYSRDLNCQGVD